jgi:hypothetical protein
MMVDALADWLAAEGVGTVGTDLFVGFLPDGDDTTLALYPTGGDAPDAKVPLDEPTVQVRARGVDPAATVARLQAVYNLLHGASRVTLSNGTWLLSCVALQSGPTFIGRDQTGRSSYVVNFRMTVRNPSRDY